MELKPSILTEKIYAYRVKRLSNRVKFFENRIQLYKDYLSIRKLELEDLAAKKIAKKQTEIEREYQRAVFDTTDQKTIFDYLTTTKATELRQKLRLKYRVQREQGRREIKKVESKLTDIQIKERNVTLEQKLASLQSSHDEIVSNFIAERTTMFEQSLTTLNKQSLSEQTRIKAKAIRQAKLDALLGSYTAKYQKKFAKEEQKLLIKIAEYETLLPKAMSGLKNLLSVQDTTIHTFAMNDVILDVNHLSMHFGGVKAVNDLSLSVNNQEIFGLIGPNGAGKTTVFNCITKFYQPTHGEMYFKTKYGETIDLNNALVHDVITLGIVRTFQNLEVIKEVSVIDNLLIAAHRQYTVGIFDHIFQTRKLKIEETVIRRRANQVLEFMGLSAYRDYYAWGLPYGILKKIEIARTLMNNPQLIILDEPAAGLNDSETEELSSLIRKIRDTYHCAILLVEHDMGLVMDVCDRICAISFGKMLAIGVPTDIQKNPDVQKAYLGVAEGDK